MTIFERDCLMLSVGEACVNQHPHHSEEEEDNEEDLPVYRSNGYTVEGTATDQSTAQD